MATATKKISDTSTTSTDLTVKKTSNKDVAGKIKTATKTTATTASAKPVAKTSAVKKAVSATVSTTEKKPAKAPAAKRTAAKKTAPPISPEHRYHMIATAAYYLAERRGFAGGYEMQDWISAEAEIDAQLKS